MLSRTTPSGQVARLRMHERLIACSEKIFAAARQYSFAAENTVVPCETKDAPRLARRAHESACRVITVAVCIAAPLTPLLHSLSSFVVAAPVLCVYRGSCQLHWIEMYPFRTITSLQRHQSSPCMMARGPGLVFCCRVLEICGVLSGQIHALSMCLSRTTDALNTTCIGSYTCTMISLGLDLPQQA